MSGSLVPASGMVQQGSVDWTSISKMTLSFSVDVLSRFSNAGVEMFTVVIGQALFSSFNVPAEGQKRLNDAIGKLKTYPSYQKVLWFGFGIKHPIRSLCESEQGSACAAMCACLSVSYDTLFSSKVLRALANTSSTPDSLNPALHQWAALVNVCSGTVTQSRFPILVEGFARLLGSFPAGVSAPCVRAPTNPESLAGVLIDIARVSNGTQRNVTIEGGIDCAWIAAVAEWLLCLRVDIHDSSGSPLYSTSRFSTLVQAQVVIICHGDDQHHPNGHSVIGRSYLVPPGNLSFMLKDDAAPGSAEHSHSFCNGRSEWNSVLKSAFGESASTLLHPSNAVRLGQVLCSGLRSPEAGSCVRAFENLDRLDQWGHCTIKSQDRSRNFLLFAAKVLPELENLVQDDVLSEILTITINAAGDEFSKALEEVCTCPVCSEKESWHSTISCLHRAALAIFQYLWALSWCDIENSIKPTSSGLVLLYVTHFYGSERPSVVRDKIWQRGVNPALLSIFTGLARTTTDLTSISALSNNGLCIYYSSLEDPMLLPHRLIGHRIVPGHIERSGRIYEYVSDGASGENVSNAAHFAIFSKQIAFCYQVNLVVEESITANILTVTIEISAEPALLTSISDIEHEHITQEYGQEDGSQDRKNIIGCAEFRWRTLNAIAIKTCAKTRVEVNAALERYRPKVAWTGPCHSIISHISQNSESFSNYWPLPGEWVVRLSEECCSRMLRGQYGTLCAIYLFACTSIATRYITLDYIGPCALCPMLRLEFPLQTTPPPALMSCSMGNKSLEVVELFCSLSKLGPMNDDSVQKIAFYGEKGKGVLRGFLQRRHIAYTGRMGKAALIELLRVHDLEHYDAARADGFLEESIEGLHQLFEEL